MEMEKKASLVKTTNCPGGPSTLFRIVLLIGVMPSVAVSVIGLREACRADEVQLWACPCGQLQRKVDHEGSDLMNE